MPAPILSIARRFQLWGYTVGHGQLLLRSTKSDRHPTRVDILFKAVKTLHLATLIDDLRIELADEETAREATANLGAWERWDHQVYRVLGRGFQGHVVAGTVVWIEDEGEYHAPSQLLPEL